MSATDPSANRRPGTLEWHATEQPDTPALVEDDRSLSYASWNDRANRLADSLERLGIGSEDKVAVRMMNRIEWFVVDAALAKLGATRVSVAWRLEPPEVRYILENSGAAGLVFDDDDPARAELCLRGGPGGPMTGALRTAVSVNETRPEQTHHLASLIETGRQTPRSGRRAAESVVYTSGTTGRPKGVHRRRPVDAERLATLRRLNDDIKRSIPYRKGDHNLLCAPLNHAAAPSSALATHARGGTVYVMRRFEPESALAALDRHRITVSFMVPTMLNRIVNLPKRIQNRYDLSSIRIITTGASPCSVALKRKVTELLGPCLYESYGSTETGIITIMTPDEQERHPGSCGRLLDGADVRILGDDGRPVPSGEVGEIFIKSPVTIDRYLAEREPSAESWRDDYFSAGDVGRLDEDGYLYILDRKKDMIISGGVNIYPAEIEAALRDHPAVLDAAAFGAPHPDWGEEVRAVCELLPGHTASESELLRFLETRLADYKRPRSIELVGELPRNAAGKVLKRELRAAHWSGLGRAI